jgi:NAD(P) transhydrogenase subunit beta
MDTQALGPYWILAGLALVLGVLLVIPIGGADMPVVISLLNSYSGLAACATGFVLGNSGLVISGSLVGASGIILTMIMCDAMNRSIGSVLFGAFGAPAAGGAGPTDLGSQGTAKGYTPEDAAVIFANARSVIVVPGYGMAVAQAQHAVRALGDLLEESGIAVKYAIHPVAGRMPGHMNVLLAEADVPYEQLVEMDEINPEFPETDVALVIGANDVVNPQARTEKESPIYGMPILDVDRAQHVFVIKRSMNPGFAGIQNPLFFHDNTMMIFGDAKKTVLKIIEAVRNFN